MQGQDLLVIDAQARVEYRKVALPGNSEGVVPSPDGQYLYVTLNSRDGVGIIDLRTMQFVGEIKTGKSPDGLAWASMK
jgi:YVTN family beta-propeller protein